MEKEREGKGKGRRIGKKALAIGLSTAVFAGMLPADWLTVSAAGGTSGSGSKVTVDPLVRYQTMESWGTSLCWFANIIGGWEEDFNGNGRSDRDEIAELIFSPDYLNMNLVRYNIGGGENPSHDHIKRVEAQIPGWKTSEDSELDPTADTNQIWFLDQANTYRKDDVINEVFSNSPPYYMTKSGCSTGNFSSSKNNLNDDAYEEFADYLTDVTAYLDNHLKTAYGTGIDYIEPINEPDTSYWGAGSTKQEGCHFDPGESQNEIYTDVQNSLLEKGLSDIKLTGTDETSVDHAISSFNSLSQSVKTSLSSISTHTYGSSNREVLSDLAASYDKDLWMSEVCYGADGHNPDSMSNTNSGSFSDSILQDLKTLGTSNWVDWQVVDSEYECLQTDSNWGLIHAVYESDGPVADYHTNLVDENGDAKEGVPSYGTWHITKQFYTLMQYSKYIKAGYTFIDIDDDNMVAALSPDKSELVIVVSNSGSTAKNKRLDLSAFSNIAQVKEYRTSDTESCEEVAADPVNGGILSISSPASSVSTYVIQGNGSMISDNAYITKTNSGVVTTADTVACNASEVGKFAYTGSWSRKTSQSGSYKADTQSTSVAGDTVSYTFEGNRAIIKGTRSTQGGKISYTIDGGTVAEVDTSATATSYGQVLIDTGELGSGTHTIQMQVLQSDSAGTTVAIDAAEVYHGTIEKKAQTPSVAGVSVYDTTAAVSFNEIDNASSYAVRFGTTEDTASWNEEDKVTGQSSPIAITGLSTGTTYYFTVEANVEGQSAAASEVYEAKLEANDSPYLYFVDAGVSDPLDTSLISPGIYQGNLEQAYGKDTATGKLWGYDSSAASGGNGGTGIWNSVRTDDQDTVGKGLTYQFELEPGTYLVDIGVYDPWSNSGRSEDIVVQDNTVKAAMVPTAKTTVSCKAVVGEDGILTVKAVRSSGNTSQYTDPLISYIAVRAYSDDAIVGVQTPDAISTVKDKTPELPSQVTVEKADGTTAAANVTWDTKDVNFSTVFSSVIVEGTVAGVQIPVTMQVYVAPANLIYYIDSGSTSAQSVIYRAFASTFDLSNDSADQTYAEGSWGYDAEGASIYGTTSSDPYTTGLYAGSNKTLTYTLPLETGDYDVTVGLHEWWGVTRPMTVSVSYEDADGETTALSSVDVTVSKSLSSTSVNLSASLPENAKNLIVSVKKNGSSDPVISWVAVAKTVQKTAKEKLQSLYGEYEALDLADYTSDTAGALETALKQAQTVLADNDSTDSDYDTARTALEQAKAGLVYNPDTPVEVTGTIERQVTYVGKQPELPQTVTVRTRGGEEKEAEITWNESKASALNKVYYSYTVKGKVTGTGLAVKATVEVIPEDLEYFIDCGTASADSAAYDAVKDAADLKNEVSDQLYSQGSKWGVVAGYDNYYRDAAVTDKFETGYYGKNTAGKENGYAYKLTLDQGIYNIMVASHEWWTGPRTTIVSASYTDAQSQNVTSSISDGISVYTSVKNSADNGTLVVTKDNTEVTLNIYASTDAGATVSFIGVNKLSDYMVTSIQVTPPSKTIYNYNEEFDTSGMKVIATYTDQSVNEVPLSNVNIIGYDKTKPGKQTITVEYAGATAAFAVTVNEKPVTVGQVTGAAVTSVSDKQLKLTWKTVSGATGYEVYRATAKNGTYQKIKTLSSTSYADTGVTTGETYYYKIRAYVTSQGKNTYGEFSSSVSAKAVPAVTSAAVTSAAYNQLKVTWKKISGATGYEIYRSTAKNGTYQKIKTLSSTSYTDKSVTTGKTYYYKIKVYKTISGKKVYGAYSSAVSAKAVPAKTSAALKKESSTKLKISWKKVSGASGYEIQYATKKDSGYQTLAAIKKGSTTSYTKTNLKKGKTYYVKVRAYRTVNGKKVYGSWSTVKSLKLK